MMTVSSPAHLSMRMPASEVQVPVRELKKNKLKVNTKKQRSLGQPSLEVQPQPPVVQQKPQQPHPRMMAPVLTKTLGRERRRSPFSKIAFFPCTLGTIEEDALYEENNSPRPSFGHLPSVCSSPDGRDDSSATKAKAELSAAQDKNAELEARLLELEKKLAELSAAQQTQ